MEGEDVGAKPADQRYYVIQDKGRYYVAVAVVEYAPEDVQNDQQKQGVEQIAKWFKEKSLAAPLQAADITTEYAARGGMITNPYPTE